MEAPEGIHSDHQVEHFQNLDFHVQIKEISHILLGNLKKRCIDRYGNQILRRRLWKHETSKNKGKIYFVYPYFLKLSTCGWINRELVKFIYKTFSWKAEKLNGISITSITSIAKLQGQSAKTKAFVTKYSPEKLKRSIDNFFWALPPMTSILSIAKLQGRSAQTEAFLTKYSPEKLKSSIAKLFWALPNFKGWVRKLKFFLQNTLLKIEK